MKNRQRDPSLTVMRIAGMLAVLLGASPASADTLAVAAGSGNFKSHDSNAAFLSYQKNAPELFNHESLYDFTLGYWNGSTRNTALTFARVVRWKISPESYLAGTFGIGVVARTTDSLGTQGQFTLRLAYGRKFGKYDLSIGEVHYSNGQTVFHWHGPNVGEDFLTLQIAREF